MHLYLFDRNRNSAIIVVRTTGIDRDLAHWLAGEITSAQGGSWQEESTSNQGVA